MTYIVLRTVLVHASEAFDMDLLQDIVLLVNGTTYRVDVAKVTPQTTLNEYLRIHLLLTGTKRMCMEGGCGACIVSVDRCNSVTRKAETFAINSCLVSIFSCHGWHITTIEGLGDSSTPHKIQEALVKFNGTQCGYCTPGMVMNMYTLQESSKEITMEQVENSFGGNICRCTGYRPILSAFKSLCVDASLDLTEKCSDIEDLNNCSNQCKKKCVMNNFRPFYFKLGGKSWIKVLEIEDLLQVIKSFHGTKTSYTIVAGNTGRGVYKVEREYDVYIDILSVRELTKYDLIENKLILGANISLTNAMNVFYKLSSKHKEFGYLKKVADHIDLIANAPVRNMGTLAGNLFLKKQHKNFPSDIFLIFETIGAKVQVVNLNNMESTITLLEFLDIDMSDKVMKKIVIPALDDSFFYESYKIMPRAQNAHALVNAGFLLKMNKTHNVENVRIVYGCINATFNHAKKTEGYLTGRDPFKNETLQGALKMLNEEILPELELSEPQPKFRKQLALSLYYKYILSIIPRKFVSTNNLSGGKKFSRPVSKGTQDFATNKSLYPLSQPIPKIEAIYQTTGEAEYITDMPDLPNQLYAAFVLAKAPAKSKILKIDKDKAMALKGVVAFFDKNDIPGKNTFTPIESGLSIEEELFCSGIVQYHSQPVGIVVAKSQDTAEKAANLIEITYGPHEEEPVFSIRDILKKEINTKITQQTVLVPKYEGNNIKYAIKGSFDLSWQYHFHMETQCCNVIPKEDGLDMYPGSQWMDLSQNAAAAVLNIPANKINVVVRRLGGGFGAKIVRNALVSSAAALAAYKLKQPVKFWLPLETNISVIGKRYPLSSDYEVGVDVNGVIQYMKNIFYTDHGCGGNESGLSLIFSTYLGTYNTEAWYTNSNITHTDMHPSCYIRAPGTAEGLAMSEAIMEHIAMTINMDPLEFKIINLSRKHNVLLKHIEDLKAWAEIDFRKENICKFNRENRWKKRGLSVVPMVYPFPLMFNFGVIVSIYHFDGSVALSHGGVEMGQGIHTKAVQVCAYKLGIPIEKVSVKPSNNLVAPNSSMTGASITSEAVCWGIIKACDTLLERMEPIRKSMNNPTWEELVKKCYTEYIHLSASSMYYPKDPQLESYEIYGVCAAEIELDVLTGQHQILRVDLLQDVGDSMSPDIDIGQVEGAFVMGQGYFTSEQIIVGSNGEILTNRTWNYKPPGVKDIPINFNVKFPRNNPNPVGVLKSKAVGEPPFCLAVSIPLAIRQAVAEVRTAADKTASKWYPFDGPSTVENTFLNCLHDYKQYTL